MGVLAFLNASSCPFLTCKLFCTNIALQRKTTDKHHAHGNACFINLSVCLGSFWPFGSSAKRHALNSAY